MLLNVERVLPARLSRVAVDVLFPDLLAAPSRSAGEVIGAADGRAGPISPISR